jgi:hypothetical protein
MVVLVPTDLTSFTDDRGYSDVVGGIIRELVSPW